MTYEMQIFLYAIVSLSILAIFVLYHWTHKLDDQSRMILGLNKQGLKYSHIAHEVNDYYGCDLTQDNVIRIILLSGRA